MNTALVTGGTDGIGKGMVLSYLQKDYHVFAVGTSENKGKILLEESKKLNRGKLTFLKADLSLTEENHRIINEISRQTDSLDALILCAASLKPQSTYVETKEGLEFTFTLYYLSRYILCYGLKTLLEKSSNPIIVNVAAPGMKGPLHLDDPQMKNIYDGQKAQFHGSRLNDLLGVWFCNSDSTSKIRYILFNPMAARTPGAAKMAGDSKIMKLTMNLYYKFAGKDISEIVEIINSNISKTIQTGLSAYKLDKNIDLTMETFDKSNAEKLNNYTTGLLANHP